MNVVSLPFQNILIGGLFTAILAIPAMAICKRLQIVSISDFRRHNRPVPLAGGICIFLGLVFTSLVQHLDLSLLLYAAPIFLIGIVDDRLELGARSKFTVQALTVGLWLYFLPPGQLVLEASGCGPEVAKILTWYWLIGLINAMNMIDGMDGSATGFSAIAATSLYFLSSASPHLGLISVLIGACVAFLFYNRPQAKAYLGDTGSTTLGFILGAIAATTPVPSTPYAFVAPLFIFAFPLMDAVLSISRRLLRRSNLFKGDRDHIHHKLQKVGCTVPQALFVIYLISIYCGAAGYLTTYAPPALAGVLIPALILAPLLLLAAIFFIEGRLARQMFHLSKSLLLTHLPVQDTEFSAEDGCRHAISFDLITYYKDLQNRGFIDVNTFINDFGILIKALGLPFQCYLFGSYTIVLTFKQASNYLEARNQLVTEFKSLLAHNGLLKNGDLLPLGMKFYAPEASSIAEIVNLAKIEEGAQVSYRRAG